MKLKTKKIHNKNKRKNKNNTNKKNTKKNYKFNSAIIHPASIILPCKYNIKHKK